jgi:hypothetical protein
MVMYGISGSLASFTSMGTCVIHAHFFSTCQCIATQMLAPLPRNPLCKYKLDPGTANVGLKAEVSFAFLCPLHERTNPYNASINQKVNSLFETNREVL